MSLVSIRDVRKSFGANEVLKGVSLEVAKGDVVAIIGRSGSGKSTLLRCINGLETYQSGAILADGIEVGGLKTNLRELRRHVGMVFQQFNLFPHLTAAENVMLAPTVVNKVSFQAGGQRFAKPSERCRLVKRIGGIRAATGGRLSIPSQDITC
jgi:polar amino acid transport system ATP-binding protein